MIIARQVFTLLIIFTFQLKTFGQKSITDTTFLLKENRNGVYHAIFIDTNKSSKYYDWILFYQFDEFENKSYQSSLEDIKKQNPEAFLKNKIFDIARQWSSLYSYKNKYYLYSPSDYMYNYRLAISDTTYIDYFGDGPTASRINSFQKVNSNIYKFSVTHNLGEERVILIHLIDKQKGIAVFEVISDRTHHEYSLMVSTDKAKDFPIIVNYCKSQKQKEYQFSNPDFDKLLKLK